LGHLNRSNEAVASFDNALAIRGISLLEKVSDIARDVGSAKSQQTEGPGFLVEWRPLATLDAIVSEWRDLAGRALEPNIFYEAAFALAAVTVYGSRIEVGLIWSKSSPQRLVGLFPVRIERLGDEFSPVILVGWRHPQAALGTPLIDRDVAEDVLDAFLDDVHRAPQFPNILVLPFIREADLFASVLDRVLARRGDRVAVFDRHHRGQLVPGSERDSYFVRAIGPKKRRNLRRLRQRLEETGRVIFATTATQPAIATALSDFFTLEASGWKGRAAQASKQKPGHQQFFEAAVIGLAAEGKARVDRLLLDDRPIAASITFKTGNDGWFWKIAYDEDLARFSPGVQLMLDLTNAFLADLTIKQVDGCAVRDNPLINHIWRERLSIGHFVVAAGPEENVAFDLMCRDIALRLSERR
jgi:hypothetical protein